MSIYDPGQHPSPHTDYLCLHRNENLFAEHLWTDSAMRDAMAGVQLGTYPDPLCAALREALAEVYDVSPDHLYVSNGADGVLGDVLGLLRRRFDTLGVLDVSFAVYPLLARRFDYRLVTLPGDTFRTGRIEPANWSGLAVIDSPNAITAARIDSALIEELCGSEETFVVWDNVYGEFAGDAVTGSSRDNLVVVRSFSKFYALAGLRIGYCIASEAIVHDLMALKDPFGVNAIAQRMALAALARRSEFENLAKRILASKQELLDRLESLGFVSDHPSAANFVLVRHRDHNVMTIESELRSRGVLVRRFPGEPASRYLRITVPPPEGIERLCRALAEIVRLKAIDAASSAETGVQCDDHSG